MDGHDYPYRDKGSLVIMGMWWVGRISVSAAHQPLSHRHLFFSPTSSALCFSLAFPPLSTLLFFPFPSLPFNLSLMASAEDSSEQLKYQTWVLRVSIHCEGCKRTVKKALQSIDGVYKTTIDAQQHKVTVTGNVDPETLIKKLAKIGKPAELWPEKKPHNNNNNNNNINNNPNTNTNSGNGKSKNKNKNKNKPSGEPSESPVNKKDTIEKAAAAPAKAEAEAPKNDNKEAQKPNAKDPEKSDPPPSEKTTNVEASAGKKKGKKGNGDNSDVGEAEAAAEEPSKAVGSGSGGGASLPRQPPPAYQYPVYPAPPPPAYVVSYNTSHPSTSYGGAYYPMPMQQSGYVFSGLPPPPPYYYAPPPVHRTASPASYDMFDDENATGCAVM